MNRVYCSVGGAKRYSRSMCLVSSMLHFQSPKLVFQHSPSACGLTTREQFAPGLSRSYEQSHCTMLPRMGITFADVSMLVAYPS